jgi:hypothetical protein
MHTGLWASRSFEKPAPDQTCDGGHACLFDLEADPTERVDVSAQHPDVVKELLARIREYNVSQVCVCALPCWAAVECTGLAFHPGGAMGARPPARPIATIIASHRTESHRIASHRIARWRT